MGILKNYKLLLLEDNLAFAKSFLQTLEIYFAEVFHATNIQEALEYKDTQNIDIIISDIKVAHENGLDFIQQVRQYDKNVAIVVLSAHKDEAFLFSAIGLNILSYELKPLTVNTLQNLLKLMEKELSSHKSVVIQEKLSYNRETKELITNNSVAKLTKKEALFLELLLQQPGAIISPEEIQKEIWEEKNMSEAALRNFLLRLRKKSSLVFIKTVHGFGFMLSESD